MVDIDTFVLLCSPLQATIEEMQKYEEQAEIFDFALAAFDADPRSTAKDAKWVDVMLPYWGNREWAVAGEGATVSTDLRGMRAYVCTKTVEAQRRAERAAARGSNNAAVGRA